MRTTEVSRLVALSLALAAASASCGARSGLALPGESDGLADASVSTTPSSTLDGSLNEDTGVFLSDALAEGAADSTDSSDAGDATGACVYAPLPDAGVPDAGAIAPWADKPDGSLNAIARDRDGNIVAAGIAGADYTMYLAKLDPKGNVLWSKNIGSQFVEPHDVIVDAAGDIVVAGSTGGGSIYDLGGGNVLPGGFVVKYDANGAFIWQKVWPYSQTESAQPVSVRALSNGDLVVSGQLIGTVDLGSGPLTAGGNFSLFVLKLDPCGNVLYSHEYGGAGEQYSTGIAVAPNDDLYVVGAFDGSIDFGQGTFTAPETGFTTFVARFDSSGTPVASRQFAGNGEKTRPGVPAIGGDGNLLLVGTFDSSIDFGDGPIATAGGEDLYVASLTPTLDKVWAVHFGDSSQQSGYAVASDTNGDVLLTGQLAGRVPFGANVLTGPVDAGAGVAQLFVARLGSNGAAIHGAVATGGSDSVSEGTTLFGSGTGAVVVGGSYSGTFTLGPASFAPFSSGGILLRFTP